MLVVPELHTHEGHCVQARALQGHCDRLDVRVAQLQAQPLAAPQRSMLRFTMAARILALSRLGRHASAAADFQALGNSYPNNGAAQAYVPPPGLVARPAVRY